MGKKQHFGRVLVVGVFEAIMGQQLKVKRFNKSLFSRSNDFHS